MIFLIQIANACLVENAEKKCSKHFTTTAITREDVYPNNKRICMKSGGFSVKINCNTVVYLPILGING